VVTRAVIADVDVINVDEASYMVGASELLHGHLPYTTFGDNKPPLIYAYYAFAQLTGGGIAAVRLLTTLVTIPLTAFAISAFYRHDRRGIVGAALFLVYSASYTASDMLAVNCEPVMMLPLAWALVAIRTEADAVRPERTFVAGMLTAVAMLVKYQAGLWVPALAFATAYAARQHERHPAVRSLAAMALGLVLPMMATLTLFAIAGEVDGLVYWNVTHNLEYLQNPMSASAALSRGAARVLPFLAVTSVLWCGWFRSAWLAPSRYWEMLVAGLIGASAAAVVPGWRFFPHYFIQLYVPLALAAAPWVASVLVRPMQVRGWAVATVTMLVFAGWTVVNAERLQARTVPSLNRTASAVAAQLKADTCYRDSSLFVWGSAPEFYYHSKLRLATQFFFPEFPLVRYYAGNPAATAIQASSGRRTRRVRRWLQLMGDLSRTRPTYILDTAPAGIARWQYFPTSDYPMLDRLIRRQYVSIGSVDGVEIYRRKGCDAPPVAEGR
jgi:hypothetical protein